MKLFSCWSNNCRGRADEQLYVGHAIDIEQPGNKTLCGVEIQECGEPITPEGIGCKRCQKSKLLRDQKET